MKYEVIDNFLDEKYFDSLAKNIAMPNSKMPWFFEPSVSGNADEKKYSNLFYMQHSFYTNNLPTSPLFEKLWPLLDKLEARCLLRVKANFFPNTEILHEHPMHTDYPFFHSAALLSLNTCDGYTKLKDGTKIDSIANRILLFDASEEHCSTTTTDDFTRVNININYLTNQFLMKGNNNNQQNS